MIDRMTSFGQEPLTIGEMQQIARERGGVCLSLVYKDSASKLAWKCAEGHRWEATPTAVKHGKTWCPRCAHTWRKTLRDYRRYARRQGGRCLETAAGGVMRMAMWQCREGHTFAMMPVHVRVGHWCPRCALGIRAEGLAAWRASRTRRRIRSTETRS